MARGALSSATPSAGASRSLPPGAPAGVVDAVEALAQRRRPGRARLGPGARASPSCWARAAIRSRSSTAWPRRRRRAAIALVEPQPQRRLRRRPGRRRLRHRPRAVRHGPRPPAQGAAPRRAARHARAARRPGDLVVHIDHGVARYEQMLRRGAGGRGARLPRALVRGRRPDLGAGRADRTRHPLRRRRATRSSPSSAAGSGCAPSSACRKAVARPGRRAAGAVRRRAPARRGSPFATTRPGSRRWRRRFPYEETHRPAARDGRGQGRHGAAAADGPARRRRRRLRQDRGRPARPPSRRSQDRQAGRGAGARRPCSRRSTIATFSQRFAAYPLEVRLLSRFVSGEGAGGDAGGSRGRDRRPRHRHASPALEGRPVPGPRPRRRRRGAALRRGRQGAPQAASRRRSTS